jgi:hypothetical protein
VQKKSVNKTQLSYSLAMICPCCFRRRRGAVHAFFFLPLFSFSPLFIPLDSPRQQKKVWEIELTGQSLFCRSSSSFFISLVCHVFAHPPIVSLSVHPRNFQISKSSSTRHVQLAVHNELRLPDSRTHSLVDPLYSVIGSWCRRNKR